MAHEANGSVRVQHDELCQPAHRALCLAFALQAMSQKHMHSAAAASSLHRPISVHDAPALQPSSELAIAIIGLSPPALLHHAAYLLHWYSFPWSSPWFTVCWCPQDFITWVQQDLHACFLVFLFLCGSVSSK